MRLSHPPEDEIIELFDRRAVKFADPGTANQAAAALSADAPQFGNWRFVVDVCREARLASAGKPLDLACFISAKTKATSRRIMQQHKTR